MHLRVTKFREQRFCISAAPDFAFPEYEDFPSQGAQRPFLFQIPAHVLLEFPEPEFPIVLWCRCSAGARSMTVPETAVHENGEPISWKNDVGTSRQIGAMQAKTESFFVEKGADTTLRFRIFAFDPRHDAVSLLGRKTVRHDCRRVESRAVITRIERFGVHVRRFRCPSPEGVWNFRDAFAPDRSVVRHGAPRGKPCEPVRHCRSAWRSRLCCRKRGKNPERSAISRLRGE